MNCYLINVDSCGERKVYGVVEPRSKGLNSFYSRQWLALTKTKYMVFHSLLLVEHCFQAKKFINVDDRSDGFSVLKNLIASHSWQNIVRIMRNFKLLDEPVIRRIMTWLSSATNQQIKLETLYELSKSNVISSRDAKGFLEGICCNWFIVYIYLLPGVLGNACFVFRVLQIQGRFTFY